MELKSLIIFLIIGAIAGWLAGNIMKGKGFGLIGNIDVGNNPFININILDARCCQPQEITV